MSDTKRNIIYKHGTISIECQKINLQNHKEKYLRFIFNHKPTTIEHMNKKLISFLSVFYDKYFNTPDETIEIKFCTKNKRYSEKKEENFGTTNWIYLDKTLNKEEWIKKISDININNTLVIYEGEKKTFDDDIKRNRFWLNVRYRPTIGYGKSDNDKDCFYKALFNANVINITKSKIIKGSEYVYKYNQSKKSVIEGYKKHIENLNELNKIHKRTDKLIYNENGGVRIEDIPKLENIFECNIIVNYNAFDKCPSSMKFNRTVYLTFKDGHYDLDKDYKPEFNIFDDKALYVPKKMDILLNDGIKYYDGKKFYYIKDLSTEEINKLYKMKHKVSYKKLRRDYNTEDIKELHDLYKKDCEQLEEYGIKVLNSYSLQKVIFQMLKLDLRYLNIQTEKIKDIVEYEIISYGTKGGYNYVYKTDTIFHNVYSYDVKSSYPSILNHPDFKIPIKKGEYKFIYPEMFKKYTELKKDKNGFYKIELQYGFYKCKISKNKKSENFDDFSLSKKEDNREFDNVKFDDFRFNEHNIYTHFDILLAKILGYNVELLNENIHNHLISENNKPWNCYTFKKEKLIDSNIIFRKIVKRLYDIKQKCKNNKIIKTLTSGIWGNLCDDKTYYTKTYEIENGNYNIDLGNEFYIMDIKPNKKDEDNLIDCIYKKVDLLTRTSLFRMKPFLLSFQRYIMYIEFIKKIEDEGGKILKIKIDGVYTDKRIEDFYKVRVAKKISDGSRLTLPPIDGDIVEDKYFETILFKNKTYYLTEEQEIIDYLDNGQDDYLDYEKENDFITDEEEIKEYLKSIETL